MANATYSEEVLEDLATKLDQELGKEGVEPEAATRIAVDVTEKMRLHWGGQSLYFPSGVRSKTSRRDAEIWNAFTGFNYAELAREHGLSEMRIRQIITRIRNERKKS